LNVERLFAEFNRLSEAPDAVARLRKLIVTLGIRGDLTQQRPKEADLVSVRGSDIQKGMTRLLMNRARYRWTPSHSSAVARADLPSGWCAAPLGHTALYINGIAFKPSDWGSSGRPIIRIQDLSGSSSRPNHTERHVEPDNLITPGDLLVSWSATLDAFIWSGPEGVLNQHIFKVVPNEEAVTRGFLYWLLKHEVRVLADSQHAHGLAMMHINRGPFLAHPVALPPLAEQHRIVAKVDELMAVCDQLEAAQAERERRRDRLAVASLGWSATAGGPSRQSARASMGGVPLLTSHARMITEWRAAVLDWAVSGCLSTRQANDGRAEINGNRAGRKSRTGVGADVTPTDLPALPDGWLWGTMDQIASDDPNSITDGPFGAQLKTSHYVATRGYRVVRLQNIAPLQFRGEHHSYVDQDRFLSLCKHHVYAGDLVVAGLVDPAIRACELPDGIGPALVKADCYRFRVFPRFSTRFALYYLNSRQCQQLAAVHNHGMTLLRIGLGNFRQIPIPVPPLTEQQRIVAKVDELMAVCDELERALTAVQTGRTRSLEAVLAQALEGALPTGARA